MKAYLLLLLMFLVACSSTEDDDPLLQDQAVPVEEMYREGKLALDEGRLKAAARLFEEVERQYPYSPWATKAQLMGAYAQYEAMQYEEAIVGLERFIDLHPTHKDLAYAWYLKALSYYEQITDVGRDQEMTELALQNLAQVERRFPGTKYARDAALKIDLAQDHLAGKEMEIGRFYLKRKNYLAAINRFQTVIRQYQTTTHVPEALTRLTESYLALGLYDEAKRNAAVLGHNYPGSEWYEDAFNMIKARSKQG